MKNTPRKRSRTTDPETSKEAEKSVEPKMKPSQRDVLKLMLRLGECTQRTLENHPQVCVKYSPSRIRSAVSELRQMGLVMDTGSRVRLESGRRAIVWDLRKQNEI